MVRAIRKCMTCGGTGRQWLMRSWFPADGYTRAKCGICGGSGESDFHNYDSEFVRRQAELRAGRPESSATQRG